MAFPCPCRPEAGAWWVCQGRCGPCWGHGGVAGPTDSGELLLAVVRERPCVARRFMMQARGQRAHRAGHCLPTASPPSSDEGAAEESFPGTQRLIQALHSLGSKGSCGFGTCGTVCNDRKCGQIHGQVDRQTVESGSTISLLCGLGQEFWVKSEPQFTYSSNGKTVLFSFGLWKG